MEEVGSPAHSAALGSVCGEGEAHLGSWKGPPHRQEGS